MKAKQIVEGGSYTAKVNGRIVTVKVLRVYPCSMTGRDHYEVLNTKTGRKTTFRSAQKFIKPAGVKAPKGEQPKPATKGRRKPKPTKVTTTKPGKPGPTEKERVAYADYLRVVGKYNSITPTPLDEWVAYRRAYRAATNPMVAADGTFHCAVCDYRVTVGGLTECPVCQNGGK